MYLILKEILVAQFTVYLSAAFCAICLDIVSLVKAGPCGNINAFLDRPK